MHSFCYDHFFLATCLRLARGLLPNGEITYDKPMINGGYPVGTRAYFSCNDGYIRDSFGPARCNNADSYDPEPYWSVLKAPQCLGNEMSRLIHVFIY